jgi:glycosyltransferase involved in cell wall biosynthesis
VKVAFCHHLSLSYYGGGEKWLIGFSNYLAKQGHNVSIYSTPLLLDGKPKVDPYQLLDSRVRYEEVWRKSVKADVVYEVFSPLNWLCFEASHPKIAGLHSQALFGSSVKGYGLIPRVSVVLNGSVGKCELAKFDAVHTLTSAYPVEAKKLYTIPNFVDSKIYHPAAAKSSVFRVGYASRKVPQKGYDTWLEVKERFSGDDGIEFLETGGFSESEMAGFYSSCHLVLTPSRVDTFGLSLVEASLCGTPVATTSLPAHKALGIDFFYADTVDAYVKAINYARNCRVLDAIGLVARTQALRYASDKVLPELEEMLKNVADT